MDRNSISALQHAAQCHDQGLLEEAETICRHLLGRYPQAVDVLHLLALVRRKRGDPDEAEMLLRRCLALDPGRPEIRTNLGNLLAAAGRLPESERAYREALTGDSRFRPARFGLARVLNRSGAHEAAETQARALIDSNAKDAEAWAVLGAACRGKGVSEKAESALRRALRINPRYGMARHALGSLLSDSGRSEEALAELDLAAATGVQGADIDFTRASTLMGLYRFDDAERLLTESLRVAPSEVMTQRLLARIRFMRGVDGFADEFASAVSRFPDDTSLRVGYSQALRGAGKLQEAKAILQDGLRRNGNESHLFAELAAACQQGGDFSAALRNAQSGLRLMPNVSAIQEVLIDALVSLGRADEAMPIIEALRRRKPLNQWYVAMEATAARLLGDARYTDYFDYEALVRSFEVAPPPGWSSIEAFHRELVPALLERHRFHAEPLDQSLRFGTQTPRSLLGDPDPSIQAFLHALRKPIDEYRAAIGFSRDHPFMSRNEGAVKFQGCWSVLLKRGGYHVNHVHSEGWISSAYYVDVPAEVADEETRSGWLKFGEPRFEVPGAYPEKMVQPKAGRLVLFPSYMWHGTTPILTDERRLTIAFDVVPVAR